MHTHTQFCQMLVQAMDADDAMGSYDPWGTGKYKGFDVNQETPRAPDEAAHEEREASAALDGEGGGEGGTCAAVAFKKRKGPGKGKFRKKPRIGEDD